MHKNELISQKCAINCGIKGNASNKNITKHKNLSGVKSISNSVQGLLTRYRIVALISIGRLCKLCRIGVGVFSVLVTFEMTEFVQHMYFCIPLIFKDQNGRIIWK